MKPELKYIRIFEAFDSEILGKTLAFINKDSRDVFVNLLKDITGGLDMPLSKLSDDQFQYLPFKRALNLNTTLEDEPCDATSGSAFPRYEVPGETCNGGMIKRKWGQSTRMVTCPICGGTGVKKRNNIDLKWVKFWFSKDGVYVNTTATDGKIRTQHSPISSSVGKFSRNIDDYDIVGRIPRNTAQVGTLTKGQIVRVNIGRGQVIGMIWKNDNSGGVFLLQDSQSGGTPYGTEWRNYAENSWEIGGLDFQGSIELLKKREEVEEVEEVEEADPYTWNAIATHRYSQFHLSDSSDVEKRLKDAHFALVLDWKELKNISLPSKEQVSNIKAERTIRKTDVLALKTDEEIRKANIARYIQALSDRINVSPDLKELPTLLIRLFGWNNCGMYILNSRNFDTLSNTVTNISKFLKSEDDDDKKYYLDRIKRSISDITRKNLEYNEIVNTRMREAYKGLQDDNKEYLPILDKYYEFNKAVMNKFFKDKKIECIEDLEVISAKLNSIRNVINSDRYERFRETRYFFENINRTDSWTIIPRYMERRSLPEIISQFDSLIKVVEKI